MINGQLCRGPTIDMNGVSAVRIIYDIPPYCGICSCSDIDTVIECGHGR